MKFEHAAAPRPADKERAGKWLEKKIKEDYYHGEE